MNILLNTGRHNLLSWYYTLCTSAICKTFNKIKTIYINDFRHHMDLPQSVNIRKIKLYMNMWTVSALSQLDPALELSVLGYSSIHNKTLQVVQRTALGPTPPKADPGCEYIYFHLLRNRLVIFFHTVFTRTLLFKTSCSVKLLLPDVWSIGERIRPSLNRNTDVF